MKQLFNFILESRAIGLAQRLKPHLPPAGRVLDIGSGTGHNARALRKQTGLSLIEADVTNMSVVNARPVLFAEGRLPFAAGAFTCALLSFVLQYPPDPAALLLEARRVAQRVLVVHTTYDGWPGRLALRGNEFVWGPVAFALARAVRLIDRCRFSLYPRHFFSRAELQGLFDRCGFAVHTLQSDPWPGGAVSHDLFVLEHAHA